MRVFRISKEQFADLQGIGGLFSWGRWHDKGVRVIYTSGSRSLAAWEKLVHVTDLSLLPDKLVMMEISIPDSRIEVVPKKIFEKGWKTYPYKKTTIDFGTRFLTDTKKLVLKIPSAIIDGEYNYMINPSAIFMNECSIEEIQPFNFDNRIMVI